MLFFAVRSTASNSPSAAFSWFCSQDAILRGPQRSTKSFSVQLSAKIFDTYRFLSLNCSACHSPVSASASKPVLCCAQSHTFLKNPSKCTTLNPAAASDRGCIEITVSTQVRVLPHCAVLQSTVKVLTVLAVRAGSLRSASMEDDLLFNNRDSKIRYEAYRCEGECPAS